MTSSATFCEELEFTWRIENFGMHRQHVLVIPTPLMSVGNPRHSLFYLNLYPTGWDETSRHVVAVEIVRIDGSFKGTIFFEISVVACDNDSTIIITNDPSSGGMSEEDSCRIILTSGDLIDKFLSDDTLVIRCKLVIYNVPQHLAVDLNTMSQTLNKLYESKAYSNLTLCTSDGEFLVHKLILSQRAPGLFNDLEILMDNSKHERKKVEGISTPALQSLIQYLYNGKLEDLPPENIPEILASAKRYGIIMANFMELTNKVICPGLSSTISKKINVLSKEVYWDIPEETTMKGKADTLIQSICFGPIQFTVKLHFNVMYANISFKCLSKLEKNLFLGCKMYAGIKDPPNWASIQYQPLRFQVDWEESEQHLPPWHLQRCGKESGLRLRLLVSASDFESTPSATNLMPVSPEQPSLFGLCCLFYDLIYLFNRTQFERSGDVMFDFGDNKLICVHKAILSAWSPVFDNMFKCDMAGKSDDTKVFLDVEVIPHVDTDTTLRLIRFFYGGLAVKLSFEEDVKLYLVSDEYQISSLFRRCSSFLECHLVQKNVCDILMLAFAYSDDLLLSSARKYFCSNQEAVMGSKEWRSLSESYPNFSSMVQEPIDCH